MSKPLTYDLVREYAQRNFHSAALAFRENPNAHHWNFLLMWMLVHQTVAKLNSDKKELLLSELALIPVPDWHKTILASIAPGITVESTLVEVFGVQQADSVKALL